MEYEPVIGLEIHAELATRSKMFCSCLNNPDEKEPNKNVCPVCLAHPGALPVANGEAIKRVIMVGLALGSEIADVSQFDRKNYFYPDLPKGYQISQYEYPIVKSGTITLKSGKSVRITRVHLEEDTGSLVHAQDGSTLVDFNRASVPLMELVTEPDLRSAQEARETAEALQQIFQYVGASHARMERGEMRVEANVSIRPKGAEKFGTKVELKNINSFKFVEKAIEFEIDRQRQVLESGGTVTQQTRGWDENKNETVLQREKESAHDYRYFPEPDLPLLHLGELTVELKHQIPELPEAKRVRFRSQFGLDEEAIEVLVRDKRLSEFFEETASELEEWLSMSTTSYNRNDVYKLVRSYMLVDFVGTLRVLNIALENSKVKPEDFAELIALIAEKKVSSAAAKELLLRMVEYGGDPTEIAKDKDLFQMSNEGELEAAIKLVIQENATVVAEYKNGKTNALQFLVGQAMKRTKGKGNPELIQAMLISLCKAS